MSKSHLAATRSQADFPGSATLNVLGSCWVKPEGHGARFYELVLSKSPKTVGECIEWAAALEQPLKAREVQAHLKWAFTSASGCLEIDGQRYGNVEPVAEQPAKPKAKAKKTKAAA